MKAEKNNNKKDKKVDNTYFNNFLKHNKAKIDSITPKNPVITKEDEWQKEIWDEDTNE